jgi:hypothetical protein
MLLNKFRFYKSTIILNYFEMNVNINELIYYDNYSL